MRTGTITLFLFVLMTAESVGQKLVDFKHSTCDEGNFHKFRLNSMINTVMSHGDTTTIKVTWVDNCYFEPEFLLTRVSNDTLYFNYKNKSEDKATCNCAFGLQFKIKNLIKRDFQIKINNWTIDRKAKRYNTDGYIVEYYPERAKNQKIYREIYTDRGNLVVEVFYDRDGNITSEKYYNETWRFLERERKN
jgi:hypothetical protein